jgi:phosphoglucosamine mutase
MTLEGMRVAIDVANGAAYKSSPCILRELGANVIISHNTPNGRNINRECGSTHPEEIQRILKETGADIGIAHDGDADRCILCDENGETVDGDEIMAITALDFIKRGQLHHNTLVATVMSNFGLDETLRGAEGRVLRTKVGDRYVIEAMMRDGFNLGGEQSGHMIFRDYSTTGDGLIAALQVLRIMVETGQKLSELKSCLTKYPQAQRNLRVTKKPAVEEMPDVLALVQKAQRELGESGRVLLRYSGTEPKVRLLIEGRDGGVINRQADEIAALLQSRIGES